jgi:HNH endonuclease
VARLALDSGRSDERGSAIVQSKLREYGTMDEAEIRRRLGYSFSAMKLEVWRRAGYKCEYCTRSLIGSSDEYYFGAHIDHVVPDTDDSLLNLALACHACNFIKRDMRFLEVADEGLPASGIEMRALIISRAAAYIASIRERNQKRLAADLELLNMLDAVPAERT